MYYNIMMTGHHVNIFVDYSSCEGQLLAEYILTGANSSVMVWQWAYRDHQLSLCSLMQSSRYFSSSSIQQLLEGCQLVAVWMGRLQFGHTRLSLWPAFTSFG